MNSATCGTCLDNHTAHYETRVFTESDIDHLLDATGASEPEALGFCTDCGAIWDVDAHNDCPLANPADDLDNDCGTTSYLIERLPSGGQQGSVIPDPKSVCDRVPNPHSC